jgi:diketogulonate reductase-like aldo/keto reductase
VHIEEIKQFSQKTPAVNQVEYTPHFRRKELKDYCTEKGIFFQVKCYFYPKKWLYVFSSFQAFSSLGRQHPDLLGDSVVVELVQKYNSTPQVPKLFAIVNTF